MLRNCRVELVDLKVGLRGLLLRLPELELMEILRVSTKGLVTAENKIDAVAKILKYSDVVKVLNRRQLKIEYLRDYLIAKRISFQFSSNKITLCRICLTSWGAKNAERYALTENDDLAHLD